MLVTTRYTITNPYLYVSGINGIIDAISVDPAGTGSYKGNMIKSGGSLYMSLYKDGGEITCYSSLGTWAISGSTLTISDVPFGSTEIKGDWTIALSVNTLHCSYVIKNTGLAAVLFTSPGFKLVTPFERDGYDVTDPAKIYFSKFITEKDQYIDIRNYKRLTEDDALDLYGNWIHAFGTNGYDLRFTPDSGIMSPHNDADSQTLRFSKINTAKHSRLNPSQQMAKTLNIEVYVPGAYTKPDGYPTFRASDAEVAESLNAMFYERCFSWPGSWAPPSIWKELTMIEKSFLKSYVRDQERESLLNMQLDSDGTVFTWGSQKNYATGTNHALFANANYINGSCRYFMATGDTDFLGLIMPKLRAAMDKLLTYYSASDKIFILNDGIHLGSTYQNGSSNLWDGFPFGYKDAYDNIYCYAALNRMAELESIVGNASKAFQLANYAADVKTGYNAIFWDGNKFIQCIDITGAVHDYDMTGVNLEAIANGLVDPARASSIIDYFTNKITPSGTADVFTRWAVGPRLLATDNPVKASGGWWVYQYDPTLGYDNVIEAGGTTLWLGYYELMARIIGKDADNAYARLATILNRFNQPDHLSGGNPLFNGENNQHGSEGNVGVWGEFPESGVFPTIALYGFMGIKADKDGLHITPNLPAALTSLAIDKFNYWGMDLSIDVTVSSVRIRATSYSSPYTWAVDGTTVSGMFDRTVAIASGQTVTLQRTPNGHLDLTALQPNYYRLKLGLSSDIVSKSHTWEYVGPKPLQNGLNVVSLPSSGFVGYNTTASDGTGGVIAEVNLPDGSKLYTDSSWKVSRTAEGDISDPAFDDTSWANATSYGHYGVSPWKSLIPGMSGSPGQWIWSGANNDELSPASIIASSASSEIYSSLNAWDNNPTSCWSSAGHAGAANTEWIRIDLGIARDVRGITLTPRQDTPGAGFPVDFSIQVSNDGIQYTTVSGHNYAGYPNPGASSQDFIFTDPTRARYVRIYTTRLSSIGGSYYCQLAEVTVKEMQYAQSWIAATKLQVNSVSASSTYPGYSGSFACDGNLGTTWSSAGHAGEAFTENITFDLGETQSVGAIVLNPTYNGKYFPKDFSIQSSVNGTVWTTVLGQSYSDYPAPNSCVDLKFVFSGAIQARYIRMNATKLRGDSTGNYYFQINEATIYGGNFTAFASSQLSWGPPGQVTDRDSWDSFFTLWSSDVHTSAASTEWIAIDMKSARSIDYVVVQPTYYGDFFPKDFKFQSSNDGSAWTDIPGASYIDYPKPGINFSNVQYFEFLTPVFARYIRMYATKLTDYQGNGWYYFQLATIGPMQKNTAYLRKTFYTSVTPQSLSSAMASSSAGSGYEAVRAIDNNVGTSWSSIGHVTEAATEWLYVDAGSSQTIKQILLKPGSGGCFPVDFKFQYGNEAENWMDIPGLSYVGYGDPGVLEQSYAIRTPVMARYIRLYITKSRVSSNGTYYAQIGEMKLEK
ncbi:hypothetical protein Back11_49700 [Paenibacillus baekrokdamisoli]|uniref:Uncharacterized protein n=1 Tax=Paenibacillus baekrokdamisoli TaxID=1712516 RepID=A0A3G9J5I0_9BACL|nr:discoidin domain-containing protein [Paenibacillus baekrokdamisoli]MBB3068799.1 hypothetical protein [Paenibacillus baekrokdamisoli]BBH23625.1 hypothetical protein Back11_49700 [Paenibacillus baekrokdamisoli]